MKRKYSDSYPTICLIVGLAGLMCGIWLDSIPMSIFGAVYVYIANEGTK